MPLHVVLCRHLWEAWSGSHTRQRKIWRRLDDEWRVSQDARNSITSRSLDLMSSPHETSSNVFLLRWAKNSTAADSEEKTSKLCVISTKTSECLFSVCKMSGCTEYNLHATYNCHKRTAFIAIIYTKLARVAAAIHAQNILVSSIYSKQQHTCTSFITATVKFA